MNDEDLQRALRQACLAEVPSFEGLPPRVAIYRALVRNTLSGVVSSVLAATRREMGAPFDAALERFLAERGPRTHYLRDVPRELVEHAAPWWREQGIEAWLLDLARHEITYFGLSTAPYLEEPKPEEVALDRPLLLTSSCRLERYDYAVHAELPPAKRAVALLYYRDATHALSMLELSDMAARVIEHAHLPLREAVAKAGAVGEDALASVARFLADLGERGVLLGAK